MMRVLDKDRWHCPPPCPICGGAMGVCEAERVAVCDAITNGKGQSACGEGRLMLHPDDFYIMFAELQTAAFITETNKEYHEAKSRREWLASCKRYNRKSKK